MIVLKKIFLTFILALMIAKTMTKVEVLKNTMDISEEQKTATIIDNNSSKTPDITNKIDSGIDTQNIAQNQFIKPIQVQENALEECQIYGVHLSPGTYFEKKRSKLIFEGFVDLYIVGFASLFPCDLEKVNLNLDVPHSVSKKVKVNTTREYTAPKDSGVNFHRYFYFFRILLEDIKESPCKFNYTITYENRTSTQFNFTSGSYCQDFHRIITFGQHDNSIIGTLTIEALKYLKFDMLILTGNYIVAYHVDNGQKQERYWNSMAPVIAQTITIFLPGRRESFDNYRMFNSRFMMPGCNDDIDCDLGYFDDNILQIYFMNFDKYIVYPESDKTAYKNKFINLMAAQMERDNYETWNFVFTNVNFYCSNPEVYENCIAPFLLLNEFEDVFDLYDINMVSSSAGMVYEAIRDVSKFEVLIGRNYPRNYMISGMAGCHNFLAGEEYHPMSQMAYTTEFVKQSVVSFDIFKNHYKTDLIEIPSLVSLDLRFFVVAFEIYEFLLNILYFGSFIGIFVLHELIDSEYYGRKYAKKVLLEKKQKENEKRGKENEIEEALVN